MKLRFLLLFAALTSCAYSQTVVSGTVTDSDGLAWINAPFIVNFYPTPACPAISTGGIYFGTTGSGGLYSITLPFVCSSTQWVFKFTPFTTPSQAGALLPTGGSFVSQPTVISGATQTLNFSPVAPRFPYQLNSYGYGPIELTTTPTQPGSKFFNQTTGNDQVWNGTTWVNAGGNPGGSPAQIQTNAGGSFGGTSVIVPVDQFAGSTLAQKAVACVTALAAASGGVCDASALTGNQTIDQQVVINGVSPTQPVSLKLGKANLSLTNAASTGNPAFLLGSYAHLIGCGQQCTVLTMPLMTHDFGHPVEIANMAHDSEVAGMTFNGQTFIQPTNYEHADSIFTWNNYNVHIHDVQGIGPQGSLVQMFGAVDGDIGITSNTCTSGACTIVLATSQTWSSQPFCILQTWGGQTLPGGTAQEDGCFVTTGGSGTTYTYTNPTGFNGSSTTAGIVVPQNFTGESVGTGSAGTFEFFHAVANPQVPPGSITISDGQYTFTDNLQGQLIGGGLASGSIDYGSGNLVIYYKINGNPTSAAVTSNVVTWSTNNSFNTGDVVQVSGCTTLTQFNGQTMTVNATPTNISFTANFTTANFTSTTDNNCLITTAPLSHAITVSYKGSGGMGFTYHSKVDNFVSNDAERGAVSIIGARYNQILNFHTTNRIQFQDVHTEPNNSVTWVDHNEVGNGVIDTPAGGGLSLTHQIGANIACSGYNIHDLILNGGSILIQRCPSNKITNVQVLNATTATPVQFITWGMLVNGLKVTLSTGSQPILATGVQGILIDSSQTANQSGAAAGYNKGIFNNIDVTNAYGSSIYLNTANDVFMNMVQILNTQNSQKPALVGNANGITVTASTNATIQNVRIDDTQGTPTTQRGVSDVSNTNLTLSFITSTNAISSGYFVSGSTTTTCLQVTNCVNTVGGLGGGGSTGVLPLFTVSGGSVGNSTCDQGNTVAGQITCTDPINPAGSIIHHAATTYMAWPNASIYQGGSGIVVAGTGNNASLANFASNAFYVAPTFSGVTGSYTISGANASLGSTGAFNLINTAGLGWSSNPATTGLNAIICRLGAAGTAGIESAASCTNTIAGATGTWVATTLNALTGFQVNSAATSGNYLRGNGTNFVSSAIQAGDLPAASLTTGTTQTLTAPRGYAVCTGACTITVPTPAAGYEFCVMNDDNVSTIITLAALGGSAQYENTARTAYGTAGTGTFTSGGAVGDKVCIVGRDSTHYLTTTFSGTWTAH